MRRFRSLFSSIAMAWCIMNSCQKVVRSIRHTALNLCADCAKKFISNAQNCGKTNQGFCTHSHFDTYAWVFDQKQNRNRASTTVFTGLGRRWLFPLPQTEDAIERKAFCYDSGDKIKVEKRACGDTKKPCFRNVSRIGKNADISVLDLRGVKLKGTR